MKRYLVIFASFPAPCDYTIADVYAESPLEAIVDAQHEARFLRWSVVRVIRWPRGYRDVDHAMDHIDKLASA